MYHHETDVGIYPSAVFDEYPVDTAEKTKVPQPSALKACSRMFLFLVNREEITRVTVTNLNIN